ncbi:protein FAM83D-like [Embiotoca jacksoni]|uniref:protein FAM83D-like n=1 Tax=Embiotoca jacksoni TaxID=100190 RepID=UPI003703ACDA
MDACDSVSVLSYRRSKPVGKVRRRVQDLGVPPSSYSDLTSSGPTLDLSHNESARLAADCLLSRGLEGYHEVLREEGEVDFLSELEKNYILENGRDGNTDDPVAADDDDTEFESVSVGCFSPTCCPAESADSDRTLAGLDQSSWKDVKSCDPVLGASSVEFVFQSDSRAAGMKDRVRQFIRKAKQALAIVMDSFSDVELLCDLLEASRKRNVSVHLLLDRLNLNLFVSMWQDLKLNGKNFPKLSVRSVDGQTYCAKTGRKLTGQIAESFIITDWTEVLTGSYSFSWLSWQVHRSLAVLLKGSSVVPFHQEFHRLYSSSKPVAGFVTFITVPDSLHLYSSTRAAPNDDTRISKQKSNQTSTVCPWACNENAESARIKATVAVLLDPRRTELKSSKGDNQSVHRADDGSQTQRKPSQLCPKPFGYPGPDCRVQRGSVEPAEHTVGAACTEHDATTRVEPLSENQDQIHSNSHPRGHTSFSSVQSQFASLTITTAAEKEVRVEESNPPRTASPTHGQNWTGHYQPTLKKNLNPEHPHGGTEGHFSQQRRRNILTKPSGITAGLNAQRGHLLNSLNFKPKVELPPDNPKLRSSSSPQKIQANTSFQFLFTHSRGQMSGLQTKVSFLETRRRDQPQSHRQPPFQVHPNAELPGSKPATAGLGTRLRPQLQTDSKVFLPGTKAKMHLECPPSQQINPPPRLNWTPHAARPRAVAHHSSFSAAHGMGQTVGGQLGWRPFQISLNPSLGRSKSMTEKHAAGFNPNRT